MTAPAIADAPTWIARADATLRTAAILAAAGDEWAAVTLFYAAYHTVRAAFLTDPVFTSVPRLTEISPTLALEDRYVTRHQGRIVRGAHRELGVNDLVRLLYPQHAPRYLRLHSASIDVRYGHGLPLVRIEALRDDHRRIREAYEAGKLVA